MLCVGCPAYRNRIKLPGAAEYYSAGQHVNYSSRWNDIVAA